MHNPSEPSTYSSRPSRDYHLWTALVAACCLWLFSTAGAAHADHDWQVAKTWVFAVGVLEWKHPDTWPGFPSAKIHRRDAELVKHFRTAGVPDAQIVYLQDRQATRKHIQNTLVQLLSQTRPGDLLVFYYAGHGFRDHTKRDVHFANYDASDGDTAWPVRAIVDTIEKNFRGEQTLLMADCCYSGGLADEVLRRKTRLNHAFLCSSFSHNSSTGEWTFTEALLKGFRGEPAVDLDANGAIELEELGNYTEWDMAFIAQQKATCGRTPEFQRRMKLAAARGPRQPRVGERTEVEWNGKWYRAQIVDAQGATFKIHYVNFDDSWDEWVGPERMRPFQPQQLEPGTLVEVKWDHDRKWYPATVLRSWYGLYEIHYQGYTAEWDEWVRPGIVRKRG